MTPLFYLDIHAAVLLLPQVQPGLGLSESWYSWIVSVLSIGELTGAVVISILLRWVYTKYMMLSSLALAVCGGVLYSIGKYGWMILIGECV